MAAQRRNKRDKTDGVSFAVYWDAQRIKEATRRICDEIVKGKSVRSILNPATRDKALLPSYVEFLEWVSDDESIAKQYTRAMEWRAEGLLEDTIVIADDSTGDTIESFDADGNPVQKANIEHIQRTKLRIEARQFALRKMAPKKYGDKVDVTSGDKPIQSVQPIQVVMDGAVLNGGTLSVQTPKTDESDTMNEK